MSDKNIDYRKIWNNFWKPIVCLESGEIDIEQIKKELCDFYIAIQEVPRVYCHITNDTLSKINYPSSVVISKFEETQEENYRQRRLEDDEEFILELSNFLICKEKTKEECINFLNKSLSVLTLNIDEKLSKEKIKKIANGDLFQDI